MGEEQVGDRAEPLQRIIVAVGDRLVGDVAAGHHQRHTGVDCEQMVQRRVGQHHAQLADQGGDAVGDAGSRTPAGQDDRPIPRAQQFRLPVSQLDQLGGGGEVLDHQRERPVLAVLARAQRRDRLGIVGAAGEVVAAEALDRDDRTGDQRRRRRRDGIGRVAETRILAGGVREPGPRPAGRAGVRLRVEAAIERVLVLGAARLAHLESGHRRQRPVVGDSLDDREPRPAVGAVDEGVAESAIARVEELGEAVLAGRGVRRDRSARLTPGLALEDPEPALSARRQLLRHDAVDRRQRRRLRRPGARGNPTRRAAHPRPRSTPRAGRSAPSHRARGRGRGGRRRAGSPTPCTVPLTRTRTRRVVTVAATSTRGDAA